MLDTEAAYWKTDVPEHFSKENCPIFIAQSLEHDCHFYGMPIQEYPGLIKVLIVTLDHSFDWDNDVNSRTSLIRDRFS